MYKEHLHKSKKGKHNDGYIDWDRMVQRVEKETDDFYVEPTDLPFNFLEFLIVGGLVTYIINIIWG